LKNTSLKLATAVVMDPHTFVRFAATAAKRLSKRLKSDGRKALIQAFKIIEGFDIDMKWKITRDEEIIAEGHKEPLWFK
jgi:hypothetical protein